MIVKMILPALTEATSPHFRPNSWRNIAAASSRQVSLSRRAQHAPYATGWKKFEPLWDLTSGARRLAQARPLLEGILARQEHQPRAAPPARAQAKPKSLPLIAA